MALTVSVLTGGSNSFETTSEMINFPITDFIYPGVVGVMTNTSGVAPATGAFAANAQGTPDMTVAVTAGACYVRATPASGNSQVVRVKNSASENVTIAANATGGTRYDWIYVKVDATNAANPDASASNVATLVTSRSTSAATDNGTPPTYGTLIAVVTVANGASTITNGNIADKRVAAGFRNENTTSEVNVLSTVSAAASNSPTIKASGQDANIGIKLTPKGTGKIELNGPTTNPYCFRARASGTTSLTDATFIKIALATEVYDYNSNFASSTYTAPVAGVYHFDGAVQHESASASAVEALTAIYVNGARVLNGQDFPGFTGAPGVWTVSGDLLLAANDTVELYHYQDSGGAEVAAATAIGTWFSGHLVHAT